jgi:hypothetical protein
MFTTIQTPNGIVANKTLNNVAAQLKKKYKTSKNLKFGFDMGFDGVWELVVQNTKTDRAVVIKQNPTDANIQTAFIYARSFANQPSDDGRYDIKNKEVLTFLQVVISQICK